MPLKKISGQPLVRHLHLLTEEVDLKVGVARESLGHVEGLKEKMDQLSEAIATAEKEKAKVVEHVENDLRVHKLERVVQVLERQNKKVIDRFELEELRKIEKEKKKQKLDEKEKREQEVKEKVREMQREKELEFQTRYAEFVAREQAYKAERKTLTDTIENLRQFIESQKRLTSDMAKAAAEPTVQVVRSNN